MIEAWIEEMLGPSRSSFGFCIPLCKLFANLLPEVFHYKTDL
jgi:hypothetical protein